MNAVKKILLLFTTFLTIGSKGQAPCDSSNSPTFQVSTNQVTLATNGVCGMEINIMGAVTSPTPGGPVSYSIIVPGAPTVSLPVVQPTPTVFLVAGIYTVVVLDNTNLCATSQTVQVTILPAPSISVAVSNTPICSGKATTLTASGASSYTWNNNIVTAGISVIPVTTLTYSLVGKGSNGCANTGFFVLNVNPSPTLTVSASQNSICANQIIQLNALGANTYSWSTSLIGAGISVTPAVTTNYTVYGTDVNGCQSTSQILISVSPCTGFETLKTENIESDNYRIKIFPNPTSQILNVEYEILNDENIILNVTNMIGELVQEEKFESKKDIITIKIESLENGVYFLNFKGNKAGNITKRLVVAR